MTAQGRPGMADLQLAVGGWPVYNPARRRFE